MWEVKIELLYLEGLGVGDDEFSLTVISNFSVRVSCVSICILYS